MTGGMVEDQVAMVVVEAAEASAEEVAVVEGLEEDEEVVVVAFAEVAIVHGGESFFSKFAAYLARRQGGESLKRRCITIGDIFEGSTLEIMFHFIHMTTRSLTHPSFQYPTPDLCFQKPYQA